MCVLILDMSAYEHTTASVLILLYLSTYHYIYSIRGVQRDSSGGHASIWTNYICVLFAKKLGFFDFFRFSPNKKQMKLLYMCLHTTIYVFACCLCVSSYYICVLVLAYILYVCICVLRLAYMAMCIFHERRYAGAPSGDTQEIRRRYERRYAGAPSGGQNANLFGHYICVTVLLLCVLILHMRYAGDPSGGTPNLSGNTVQAIVRYEKKDGQVRSLLALLVQKYEY